MAARLDVVVLEISEALSKAGGQDSAAELILKASVKAIDCDLAWISMVSPIDGVPSLRRVLTVTEKTPLPRAEAPLSKSIEARFAKPE